MREKLILIGGGGHCRSVIDVAENAGFQIIGILDLPERVGTDVLGYPVIGTDDDIPSLVHRGKFIISVGMICDNTARTQIAKRVVKAGGEFATLIASDAYVSKFAVIGEGTVVMHKAFVNAGVVVGKNCIINTMTNLEHDVKVGDFCHVSTGCMVNGGSLIGDNCFLGSGSIVFQNIKIADRTIVPAGSIVISSI